MAEQLLLTDGSTSRDEYKCKPVITNRQAIIINTKFPAGYKVCFITSL